LIATAARGAEVAATGEADIGSHKVAEISATPDLARLRPSFDARRIFV